MKNTTTSRNSQPAGRLARLLATALLGAVCLSKATGANAPAFTMNQTLSDEAQRTTLAFDGLAMMTGNLDSQSFFPPGKVADYTGFQYLRDNDPDNMGHNTSFLTRVANNVIYILNDTQLAQLTALAVAQQDQINLYGYKRFRLMKAFRRLIDGDIPSGSAGLDSAAVKLASKELYLLDGQISFDRALLYANIYSSMNATQKAYLDAMKGKGWSSWPDISNAQIESKMRSLPQGSAVAVMTYASDLFSWYAGSLEADVYFCPERHGTYYGGFYIKDAPAVGHEGYSISEMLTATAGAALCDSTKGYVTVSQAAVISSLVDTQRSNLYTGTTNIVSLRTQIATLLRSLLVSTASSDSVKTQVLALSATYGQLDGENNYHYATVFAQVFQTLTTAQKTSLAALRKSIMSGTYADGIAFDFSVCSTPFLYSAVITDTSLLDPYIADTDGFFLTGSTPDTTLPVLSVVSPSDAARLTSANATFSGKAVDLGSKPAVAFSTDTGLTWSAAIVSSAESPYSWTAIVPLVPGTNTILFRATDLAGNVSLVVSRTATCLLPSSTPLQITAQGSGTFNGGLSGKTLILNMPYTVTATPAKGMVFKEWFKNGVSASTNATLTFLMEEGLVLTPVFISNPYSSVAGTFYGVVGEGDIGDGTAADRLAFFQKNGFLTLTTTAAGNFTGSLRLAGQVLALSGKFDASGMANLTVNRPGTDNATVSMKFDVSTPPGNIAGNVTTSDSALHFTALPGVYTGLKSSVHPLAGNRYTVLLPSDDAVFGHGYGTLVIAANGTATFAGKLADGASFATSSRTVDDSSGSWVVPVYIPLYTGSTGMLFGEILLPKTEPTTGPAVLGSLGWLCQNATTPFLKALAPAGESYSLDTGISLLSGTSATGNFTLVIGPSAGLSAALTQAGTWPSTNIPVLAKPIPGGMTFSLARATGVISGTFSQKVNGKAAVVRYQGVVLANPLTLSGESHTIFAGGFFLGTAGFGPVEITSP